MMEINLGKSEILSSGTVISILNQPIIFKFKELIFEVHFIDDEGNKKNRIDYNSPEFEKTKLILNFINFNNTLYTGNVSPLLLGTFNNKNILLNYRVAYLAPNAGKLFHYTWILNERTKGDENE